MFAAMTVQALLILVPAPREKEGPDKGPGFLGIAYDEGDGNGFTITEVYENSPAKKAGLEVGDRLMTCEAKKRSTIEAFQRQAIRTRPGSTVEVEIQRGTEKKKIKVKVGARPEDFPFPLPPPEDPEPNKDTTPPKDKD